LPRYFLFGTPAICVGLTLAFGDLCWPQRVGAIYIGVSVFMQGFIAADPSWFSKSFSDGTTLQQHINQPCYVAAFLAPCLLHSVVFLKFVMRCSFVTDKDQHCAPVDRFTRCENFRYFFV
jgi:hypothetical protein